MADVVLRDALASLKTKIQTLTQSSTATAEDMAMLGVALEKIAGRVSATEIELIADELKATLTALANARLGDVSAASTSAVAEINDLLDQRDTRFLARANAAETAYDANASSKTTTFNANATTRTNAVNTAGTQQVAKVVAATGAALATPTFAEGAITYNRRGFVVSWVSETGKTYTEIAYDRRDRITGWLETFTDSKGVVARYRYAATYDAANSNIKTLTRTLVA